MKAIVIATFVAAVSVFAASIYFAKSGDSTAQEQAVETISARVSKTEAVESTGEPTVDTVAPSMQPILDSIRKKIEATAAENNPGDVSAQLLVVETQTEAYRKLKGFSRPDGVPGNVFQDVSRSAGQSHEDDYAAQLTAMEDQLQGYRELKSLERPAKVPDDIVRAVARDALERYPSDFAGQFNLITTQLTAYQELQQFERPPNIPENVFQDVVHKAAKIGHSSDFSTLLLEIETRLKTYQEASTNSATR